MGADARINRQQAIKAEDVQHPPQPAGLNLTWPGGARNQAPPLIARRRCLAAGPFFVPPTRNEEPGGLVSTDRTAGSHDHHQCGKFLSEGR